MGRNQAELTFLKKQRYSNFHVYTLQTAILSYTFRFDKRKKNTVLYIISFPVSSETGYKIATLLTVYSYC